jgi:ribonucleotide reductase alpha subunit
MQVQKRNGSLEQVKFDKVTTRIEKLSDGLDVSPVHLAQKVLASITDGIKTSEIDDITADIAVSMPTGDYPTLAARIIVSNLHKTCPKTFAEAMYLFYNDNPPYVSALQRVVVYPERDNLFDFFGLKTLMRMYLKKDIETPQYMFMRVALAICDGDPVSAQETYDAMSLKYYTHATPTLFNAGTSRPQCSSCFIAGTMVDTVNRGPVPIEEIDIGDVVTTHIGNEKPVDQVHRNLLAGRQLYTLQVGSHMPVTATEDHRFWTINGLKDPEWVRMDRLKVGDYIKTLSGTFQRVNSVEPVFVTPKYVYTLGVADDHSYTVYGVVAENCYLLSMKGDSIEGIYDTKKECALISRMAGGIGLHIHNIRAKGSKIYGTDGVSDGIIPMLRTINADARYVNQSGRRKGSYAIYLEPWHADVMDFLELRLNQGDEEARCRDLFTAMWIPDLFMKRLEANQDWSLFCPNEAPGLADVYGDEFEALYEKYEREGKARCSVPIQKVWLAIIKSQVETGTPYMLYKDQCNRKSNQKNLGTIKSSNLCVAPETWVRTSKGDRPIALLENQDVEVWNGHEWSPVTVRKTADSAELMDVRVRMSNEVTTIVRTISCTPEHKFILYDGSRVDAKDLQSGTELNPWVDQNGVQHTGTIVIVQYTGRKSSTYCFTEPLRHQGMFNGIITGQCTEILEYTDPDTTAVCNLASIGLPTFVEASQGAAAPSFNYDKLEEITRLVTRNLNKVIDYTYYPVDTAKRSNLRYRPIGIGVQGLADVYAMLKLNYGEGTVNRDIFETIYYAAVSESVKLAQLCGAYEGFEGSPASRGEFQFDMWGVRPTDRYDWKSLRADMMKYGLRNSLLVAPMPTATTSQMFGFNECFEPFTSNIYLRRTLAGEFVVVNKYLVEDLKELGLWTLSLRTQIIRDGGSIAGIEEIPEKIRARYKTTWEISPRLVIDLAKERGPYICQSQSMNIFVEGPTNAKLSSIHMYAWKSGLKTGMYYLRTRPRTKAIQFTVDPSCVMCSS